MSRWDWRASGASCSRCWSQDLKLRRGAICQEEPNGRYITLHISLIGQYITILKGVIYHHFSLHRACLLGSFLTKKDRLKGLVICFAMKSWLQKCFSPYPWYYLLPAPYGQTPRQLMFGSNGTQREPTTDREWREKEKCVLQQGAPPKNDHSIKKWYPKNTRDFQNKGLAMPILGMHSL